MPGRIIPSRRPWRGPVTVAAMLLLIVVLYVARSGTQRPSVVSGGTTLPGGPSTGATGPFGTAPTSTIVSAPAVTTRFGERPASVAPRDVTLYVDGWTLRTLGGTPLTLTAADGTVAAVEPQALDVDQLGQLAAKDPEVLAAAFSRLVTSRDTVTCSMSGCRDRRGPLDVRDLADPAGQRTLGRMYAGWHVEHGLYVARITMNGPGPYRLAAGGYVPVTLDDPRGRDLAGETTGATPGRVSDMPAPGAESGWGRGVWYVSAAFGRLFPTVTLWGGSDPVAYVLPRLSAAPSGDSAAGGTMPGEPDRANPPTGSATRPAAGPVAPAGGLPLLAGLGDLSLADRAGGLTVSQLTYLSSPTTGCSPSVLCAPTRVETTSGDVTGRSVAACDGTVTVTVTVREARVRVELDAPVLMPGADGGSVGGGLLSWSERPLLRDGKTTVRQLSVAVWDRSGRLVALAGGRTSAGGSFDANAAGLSGFFDGRYRPCP